MAVPSSRKSGNRSKLMHRKFDLNVRKNFLSAWVTVQWNRSLGVCVVSLTIRI